MNTQQINHSKYDNSINSFLFNPNQVINESLFKNPSIKKEEPTLMDKLFEDFQCAIEYDKTQNDDIDLIYAAYKNNSAQAKYLLTSPETKERTNIHTHDDLALQLFIAHGNFHMTQYLLTSPDIKEHADIHADNEKPLIASIKQKQYKITQYLLNSPELNEHANIHAKNNAVINNAIFDCDLETINACVDYARLYEPKHILHYQELIKKYGIFDKIKNSLHTINYYSRLAMQYSNITNSVRLNS